jgi:hypothetical protein
MKLVDFLIAHHPPQKVPETHKTKPHEKKFTCPASGLNLLKKKHFVDQTRGHKIF